MVDEESHETVSEPDRGARRAIATSAPNDAVIEGEAARVEAEAVRRSRNRELIPEPRPKAFRRPAERAEREAGDASASARPSRAGAGARSLPARSPAPSWRRCAAGGLCASSAEAGPVRG